MTANANLVALHSERDYRRAAGPAQSGVHSISGLFGLSLLAAEVLEHTADSGPILYAWFALSLPLMLQKASPAELEAKRSVFWNAKNAALRTLYSPTRKMASEVLSSDRAGLDEPAG